VAGPSDASANEMELLRNVLGGGESRAGGGGAPSSAETIERLVDRLANATLLEDRRDACRALKAMSRKFRVEVGAQALDRMVDVLEHDRADEDIVGYALDCLCNVCSPDEFDEELAAAAAAEQAAGPGGMPPPPPPPPGGLGEQFTEIYLKQPRHVQLVVDLLEEFDFRVRRPAVKLLTHLLLNKPRQMQELILSSQLGVSRLMDVLADTREVLRNDALLLLIQLTKGHANLQKIVAFENCFDKLADIVETEGHSDGGIVVEDCLRLALNLLRNNTSNQTFFREGSYIQRLAEPFFELTLDEEEVEVGWSAQKVANMLNMLLVVRTLVSPSNPTAVTASCQSTVLACGLLERLCSILLAAGIPAEVLTETIIAIAECMRGHLPSQEYFSRVTAPSSPPRPALILLLMSMVNEKQPFSLRCAVLYCFQCYLHKNPAGQTSVMGTLLPDNQPKSPLAAGAAAEPEVSAGQLLCGGLFSADRLSNWFAAVALAHGLSESEGLKTDLLRVQLSTATGNEPVSLLIQCCNILQHTPHVQTRLGMLILLSTWTEGCPAAVNQLVGVPSSVPFLTGQVGSNEHDETERLGQGLCAFLLGLCVVHNDDSDPRHAQEQLYQLIEKRIGFEVFMDKLGEVSRHEGYNKALKHPQIKSAESRELLLDHKFCAAFKHLEHKVALHLHQKRDKGGNGEEEADPAIVLQYKEVIREQDEKIGERDRRIADLTKANLYLQSELGAARQQAEELQGTVQSLKDLNSVLRAQQSGTPSSSKTAAAAAENGPVVVKPGFTAEEKAALEREVKIRDDIIQELEIRLSSSAPPTVNGTGDGADGPTQAEMDLLQSQVRALQQALARRDEEDCGRAEARAAELSRQHREEAARLRVQAESAREEQEDLLVLLSDQEQKLAQYRARLEQLGVADDVADEQ
jgi:hypothetical protein